MSRRIKTKQPRLSKLSPYKMGRNTLSFVGVELARSRFGYQRLPSPPFLEQPGRSKLRPYKTTTGRNREEFCRAPIAKENIGLGKRFSLAFRAGDGNR